MRDKELEAPFILDEIFHLLLLKFFQKILQSNWKRRERTVYKIVGTMTSSILREFYAAF